MLPIETPDIDDLPRIRWCCRRGMLELDLILMRYFDDVYPTLEAAQQQEFVDLLSQPDPVLFAWFIGQEQVSEQRFVALVQRIQTYCRQTND